MKFSLIAIAFATAAMANPITRVRRQDNGAFANVKVITDGTSGSTQIAGVPVGAGKQSFNIDAISGAELITRPSDQVTCTVFCKAFVGNRILQQLGGEQECGTLSVLNDPGFVDLSDFEVLTGITCA